MFAVASWNDVIRCDEQSSVPVSWCKAVPGAGRFHTLHVFCRHGILVQIWSLGCKKIKTAKHFLRLWLNSGQVSSSFDVWKVGENGLLCITQSCCITGRCSKWKTYLEHLVALPDSPQSKASGATESTTMQQQPLLLPQRQWATEQYSAW